MICPFFPWRVLLLGNPEIVVKYRIGVRKNFSVSFSGRNYVLVESVRKKPILAHAARFLR